MTKADVEILRPLVDRALELATDPQQARKKELWARHQALQPTAKIPISVTYEGIPAQEWDLVFGPNHLRCSDPLAQQLEFDLKRRIWVAEKVGDDHIFWPFCWVSAVTEARREWGVPLEWRVPAQELGAKQIIAPFADGIDLSRLTTPEIVVNEEAARAKMARAEELLQGWLRVQILYPHLGYAPFDTAVRMRGMEKLLYDVYDQPQAVHGLMDHITAALEAHHRQREAKGWINCVADRHYQALFSPWRVHASYLPPDHGQRPPRLADEWAYVTDQTSTGLGPAMYAEFVNRYHIRLASSFTNQTVYYHGCETLDQKMVIIKRLPNLRRIHVSPWSSVAKAVEVFQGRAVMEVHAHPGKVMISSTPQEMRAELRGLIEASQGMPLDLNLSDIHSLNGKPGTLAIWTRVAQELSWR